MMQGGKEEAELKMCEVWCQWRVPSFADCKQRYTKGREIILWLQWIWEWIPNWTLCLNIIIPICLLWPIFCCYWYLQDSRWTQQAHLYTIKFLSVVEVAILKNNNFNKGGNVKDYISYFFSILFTVSFWLSFPFLLLWIVFVLWFLQSFNIKTNRQIG